MDPYPFHPARNRRRPRSTARAGYVLAVLAAVLLLGVLPWLAACERVGAGTPGADPGLVRAWAAADRLGGLEVAGRPPLAAPPDAVRKVAIAVTGDLKGWITRDTLFPAAEGFGDRGRGLAHLAAPLRRLRREHPGLVLLDAGDALRGAPSATLAAESSGLPGLDFPIVTLMNALGYDAMALGNFDLGLGWASLAHAESDANFTWLSANLWRGGGPGDPAGGTRLAPYRLLERQGVRLAVLGMTTPRATLGLDPRHLEGLRLGDLAEAARFWVPFLRRVEGADLVIGLFHAGLDTTYQRDVALLARPPWGPGAGHVADEGLGFDLVVAGDAHRLSPRRPAGSEGPHTVPVLEPGGRGNGLALAVFTVSARDGRWAVTGLERRTLRAEPEPDPEALARVAEPLADVRRRLAEPTALRFRRVPHKQEFYRCAGTLMHRGAAFLTGEPPGSLLSLLPMRWRYHPPRKSELGRPLRRAHLYRWMPYAETLVPTRLTGRQVELLLAGHMRHLRGWRVPDLEVFWPGGLRLTPAPSGSGIESLAVAASGEALQPDRFYPVQLTDYTWHGGAGLAPRALIRPEQRLDTPQDARPISLRAALFALLLDPAFEVPPPCARWLEPDR